MDSRISNIIKHYQELSKDMETASLHGDSASIQRIAKEMGELSPINALALKAQILSEEITEAASNSPTEEAAMTRTAPHPRAAALGSGTDRGS